MINVTRISHSTFLTPDLDRQVEYLINILGLSLIDKSHDQAFLGTTMGQQIITLQRAEAAGCHAVSFQTDPNTPIEDTARKLTEHGIDAKMASDAMPGIGKTLSFHDPEGTEIQLYSYCDLQHATREHKAIVPLKLGHLAFNVTDIQQIVAFYRDVLGFRVSDWRHEIFVFMRCGPEHHAINFALGQSTKMHHIAYEVKDWAEMLRACDWLGYNGYHIIWGPGRHIIGDNIFIYHRDPDGQVIELYCEMAKIEDDCLGQFATRPWRHDLPYKPQTWDLHTMGNFWGPPIPDNFGK